MASESHEIHRVVTGHDAQGRSMVMHSGPARRSHVFKHIPGMAQTVLWATSAVPALPYSGVEPTLALASIVPGPGETRLLMVTFPPDSVFAAPGFDGAAAQRENLSVSPGLAELFEPDGMHRTPTIDYGIVLEGELWLELDDGRCERLAAHDVVVQNGTRHAWRNKSTRPAKIAFVLIGAART